MISDTATEAAASWWAEAIRSPAFKMTDGRDGQRDQELGFLAGFMGRVLADEFPVSAEAAANFAALLTKVLNEKILDGCSSLILSVDYGPCDLLAEVAKEAGISVTRFPWKTCMWIEPESVIVSAGYGAPDETIWGHGD